MTIDGQRMSKTLGTIIDPIVAADRLGRRRRSAAAVSDQGDRLRRRRRLLVGTLRRALQRRPREQPRQPRQPRRRRWRGATGAASSRPAAAAIGSARAARRAGASPTTAAAMERLRAARGRRGGVPADRRRPTSSSPRPRRGRSAKDPAHARSSDAGRCSTPAEAIRLAAVMLAADHAGIVPRDPPPGRRQPMDLNLDQRRPMAQRR